MTSLTERERLEERLSDMEDYTKKLGERMVTLMEAKRGEEIRVTLLVQIAVRLEMIYLVLRGGIDGKKEE